MNELDFILLVIILGGAAIGLKRGVLRILFSIAGMYVSIAVIGYAYGPIGRTIAQAFGQNLSGTYNFSYVILLIATTVAVELVSRATFEETHLRATPYLDRLLGAAVGLVYGAFWASLFLVPVQYGISQTGGSWAQAVYQSQLVPTLNNIFASAVLDIVGLFFGDGVPALFLNGVSARVSYLLPALARLV